MERSDLSGSHYSRSVTNCNVFNDVQAELRPGILRPRRGEGSGDGADQAGLQEVVDLDDRLGKEDGAGADQT